MSGIEVTQWSINPLEEDITLTLGSIILDLQARINYVGLEPNGSVTAIYAKIKGETGIIEPMYIESRYVSKLKEALKLEKLNLLEAKECISSAPSPFAVMHYLPT